MAKGHGPHRKKESRRQRGERKGGGDLALSLARQAAATTTVPHSGVEATRGPVSGAFRAWASEFARRQAQALADQFEGVPVPPDLFVLAPLTTRTVERARWTTISMQMGLPHRGHARRRRRPWRPTAWPSPRCACPKPTPAARWACSAWGRRPICRSPSCSSRRSCPAKGCAAPRPPTPWPGTWPRAVEAGDVALEPSALVAATGEALALLRPNAVPRGATRLDPAVLEAYEGYGAEADEDAGAARHHGAARARRPGRPAHRRLPAG